jgi:glutathione S-transferase
MILIGQYDSPYVRRVAVSLHALGLPFARQGLSVFGDADAMRTINPLGRVPSLVLDTGEVLVDSAAILDHLDEIAGSAKALLPAKGEERRHALQIIVLATGAIDKAAAIGYEQLLRPADRVHQPWIDRNKVQLDAALLALEELTPEKGWFGGGRLLQPDITVAVALGYIRFRSDIMAALPDLPKLARLSKEAEALPAFVVALPSVDEIGGPLDAARAGLARFQGLA